ncbi:uncharacterized [Tachysurus ichikawai]
MRRRINSRLPVVVHSDFRGHLYNARAIIHDKGFHSDRAGSRLYAPPHPNTAYCTLSQSHTGASRSTASRANADSKKKNPHGPDRDRSSVNVARVHKHIAANGAGSIERQNSLL